MKKYLIIILLIGLLTIAACKDKDITVSGFKGGTKGLEISFLGNAPPNEFSQGQSVPVTVVLKNSGETDVSSGEAKAKIIGINPDNFGLDSNYRATTGILKGISELLTEGGEQQVSFGSARYDLEVVDEQSFSSFGAQVCYPYETKGLIDVCIKPTASEETICKIDGEKIVAGSVSSAPVQVTSLTEEQVGTDKVRFTFTIQNKGKGDVYSANSNCEDIEKTTLNLDKDKINVNIINPTNIKCAFGGTESNTGEIVLTAGTKTFTCWLEAKSAYAEKLNIKLNYKYIDTVTKQITIVGTLPS